ncbi:hypothetical protein FBU59_001818 [Linderina macrospora]|uniref:Uncharacterized protein n=1 Tax=Linderina macrospora TaxID=4868 RepID=A0ACC1JCQ5_9FUNG|nr:hypothetical protein FBU59_001818 [Linderina macrospora]
MTLNRSSSPLTPLLPSEPTNNQKTVVVKKIVYMLELVNNERRKFGKPALRLNAGLNSAAQAHSNYQSSIHKMTHDNPKGGLFDRMKPFVTGARGAAENVAFNQRSVDEVMKAWITSPGHHDNIVGDYNSVGFGQSNLYWTQEFAAL